MWKQTLAVTGGVVRPIKCTWVLIDFKWVASDNYYKSIAESPGSIYLQNDNRIEVEIERERRTLDPCEKLGIQTVVTGCEDLELEYLHTKITEWLSMIEHSTLSSSLNTNALLTHITKSIEYPLPTTCFSKEECRELELALYPKTLPKCGISSKFPLVLRYAAKTFYGLLIPSFYHQQGLHHCKELIKSLPLQNTTSQQFQVSQELIQITLGSRLDIFQVPSNHCASLIDKCWMQEIWDYLS